jgi:hypothetical protein
VFAPIEKTPSDENAELAVKIEMELVPIQLLTGFFVGSNCATYAEKPKVFFFLDLLLDDGKKVDGPKVCHNSLRFRIFLCQYVHYISEKSTQTKGHMHQCQR